MTEREPKPDRTEMWKAVKWTMIALIALLVAVGVFKAYKVATAPARVVSDAAGSVQSGALALVNRLDVQVSNARRFDGAANKAFATLNTMPASKPDGVKARGFRLANFNGAQDRVCEMSHDFGNGAVPVFIGADNAAHEAAKTLGSAADRLIRIVVVSPEETLGLNAVYDDAAGHWQLGWRPSTLKAPYDDVWADDLVQTILPAAPKVCGAA